MPSPFDKAWIESELPRLITVLHQTEGQIAMLQQMLAHLNNGAAQVAPDVLSLDDFQELLPDGDVIDQERGIAPHED